jgi:two-component system, NarL family, response regulator DegU
MIFFMEKKSLFIVDDHDLFRQGLKSVIAQVHDFYLMGEAEDGGDALPQLLRNPPDILLLDIEMPNLDGPGLIRLIRDAEVRSKIIILSQACEDDRIKELLELGVDGHILKIDPSEEILKALRSVSNNEKYFSTKIANRFYELLTMTTTPGQTHSSLAQKDSRFSTISEREFQVIRLVAEGFTNKRIAEVLNCSENTIKTHKANIMRKIGAKNSVEIGTWFLKLERA